MISVEEFFSAMERYNLAVQPAQPVSYVLAALCLFLAVRGSRFAGRVMGTFLGCLWIWNGAVELIVFFRSVSPQYVFWGALWILQGILFVLFGFGKGKTAYRERETGIRAVVGTAAVVYALIAYPLLGSLTGHGYPMGPVFGVAPCPVCIFTFGVLVAARVKIPLHLLILPLIWSMLGLFAAAKMGVWADLGETAFGVAGFVLILTGNRSMEARQESPMTKAA